MLKTLIALALFFVRSIVIQKTIKFSNWISHTTAYFMCKRGFPCLIALIMFQLETNKQKQI